jgi:hypothetical protein
MSSNTFKWFFKLLELETYDIMIFLDKSVNNKQSPNQTLFRLLKNVPLIYIPLQNQKSTYFYP